MNCSSVCLQTVRWWFIIIVAIYMRLFPLKNLKQGPQGQTIEKNLAELKSELQNIIVPEMVVIEIEWKFKGKKFTSEAIAWPKGSIVYDNIGTFVLGRTDKVEM